MIKKLLILSDNHGDLNEMVQIIKHEHADLVVHAGDYNLPISTMKQYFNYFVDGNNDYGHVRQVSFNFANKKFLLLHGDEF
jgi:predicted phosphodiesterase